MGIGDWGLVIGPNPKYQITHTIFPNPITKQYLTIIKNQKFLKFFIGY